MREKAIQAFREAVKGGIAPDVVEEEISKAGKLDTPGEIVYRIRKPKDQPAGERPKPQLPPIGNVCAKCRNELKADEQGYCAGCRQVIYERDLKHWQERHPDQPLPTQESLREAFTAKLEEMDSETTAQRAWAQKKALKQSSLEAV